MGSLPPVVRRHFPRRTLLRELMHANIYFVNLYIFTKWASLVAQMVKELAYNAGDPGSIPGRPGPLFEGNPMAEGTTRRGTATPVHRPQRPAELLSLPYFPER